MDNVFYFYNINSIGGTESFLTYTARKYKDKDITIYYANGDNEQLNRLSQYVRVRRYTGKKIKCNKIFFNYGHDIIDNVEAKEYIQIIHADYKTQKIKPQTHPKITRYIGVSQHACDSFEELTGIKPELCYNPIELEKPKKVLKLISATRLTKEKGKERMQQMGEILDKAGIPYLWLVFTNDRQSIHNPRIIYQQPTLDITGYIKEADYLVQLSDCEAYCYSVVEALKLGIPVIVTDMPVMKEIGVKDKENGFILDFNLGNINANEIYKGLPRFEYKEPKDNWGNILGNIKSKYKEEKKMNYRVRATKEFEKYADAERNNCRPQEGDVWEVSSERAEKLERLGLVEIIEAIKEVEEPKEDVKEEKKPAKKSAKKITKKKEDK